MGVSVFRDLGKRTAYTHSNSNEALLPKISITKDILDNE